MAQRILRSFTVLPHLPDRLQGLHKLAYNLWWCWNHEASSVFRRIDDQLFVKVEGSPVKLLASIDQDRLEQLLHDDGFLAHMDRVVAGFDNYLSAHTWFKETYGGHAKDRQALIDQFNLDPPSSRRNGRTCSIAIGSLTSRPSSACTRACRSIPAAWACWPATISRRPPTWACRWSASA